jgi:hypothetical protein
MGTQKKNDGTRKKNDGTQEKDYGTLEKDYDVHTYKIEEEKKPTSWNTILSRGYLVVAIVFVIFYIMAQNGIKL